MLVIKGWMNHYPQYECPRHVTILTKDAKSFDAKP